MDKFSLHTGDQDFKNLLLVNQFYDFLKEKDYEKALKTYLQLIKKSPSEENYTIVAWLYYELKEYDKAIDACNEAIMLNNNFGNAYNVLGSIYFTIDPLDEENILDCYFAAINATTYLPEKSRTNAFCNLALYYENKGYFKEALQFYNKGYLADKTNQRAEEGRFLMLTLLN